MPPVATEQDAATKPPSGISDRSEIVIRPSTGWGIFDLRDVWHHRELLYFFTWRDIKVRYKQSVLGVSWAVLQPTLMMIVFGVIFGRLAKLPSGDLPYPVFVFAGLLPWTFFANAVTNAANSVVASERLVTKVYFPRLLIPLSGILTAVFDFFIACVVLALLMVWYGVSVPAQIVWLPVALAFLGGAAVGTGTLLAALNVAYRDVRYVVPFMIQLWMFATPTIYMSYVADDNPTRLPAATASVTSVQSGTLTEDAPTSVRVDDGVVNFLLNLNPLSATIGTFRSCVVGGPVPWSSIPVAAMVIMIVLLVGVGYFRYVEDSFADVI